MAASGHPPGLPELFLDRSLGRRQVPERLRAQGLHLHTLAEVYGIPDDQQIADETWLEYAGLQGWVVLMKDERIRYRSVERDALLRHGVRAFCLANGNLRAGAMAAQFLSVLERMTDACASPGPFLHVVTSGRLRVVDL